jgi:hypothetical protein
MLIKYRSGVLHSTRNARCMNHIRRKIFGRSIVHMRRFFTLKQMISTYVNRSMQMIKLTEKNDIRTLLDYHPDLTSSPLGMTNSLKIFYLKNNQSTT